MPNSVNRTVHEETLHSMCAEQRFKMCKEVGLKLDIKHWYDHVPKSVETSHKAKVAILRNQQL